MQTQRILLLLILSSIPAGLRAQTLNEDLIQAARKSNVEAVKTLLEKGADANAKTEHGATPIFFACDRGNTEIVKLLLEHGADVTISDTFYKSTPIVWAVMRDRAEVVKLMIEKHPQNKPMVMGMAIGQGRVAIAKMLLEA